MTVRRSKSFSVNLTKTLTTFVERLSNVELKESFRIRPERSSNPQHPLQSQLLKISSSHPKNRKSKQVRLKKFTTQFLEHTSGKSGGLFGGNNGGLLGEEGGKKGKGKSGGR